MTILIYANAISFAFPAFPFATHTDLLKDVLASASLHWLRSRRTTQSVWSFTVPSDRWDDLCSAKRAEPLPLESSLSSCKERKRRERPRKPRTSHSNTLTFCILNHQITDIGLGHDLLDSSHLCFFFYVCCMPPAHPREKVHVQTMPMNQYSGVDGIESASGGQAAKQAITEPKVSFWLKAASFPNPTQPGSQQQSNSPHISTHSSLAPRGWS
jgi:hypothetical protein